MAKLKTSLAYPSGSTIYALITNDAGQYWNGTSFENATLGDYSTYGVAAVYDNVAKYDLTIPTTIAPATNISVWWRLQAGGAISQTDNTIENESWFWVSNSLGLFTRATGEINSTPGTPLTSGSGGGSSMAKQAFDSTSSNTAAVSPKVFGSVFEFVIPTTADASQMTMELVNGSDAAGPVVVELWGRTANGGTPFPVVKHSAVAQSVVSQSLDGTVQSIYPPQIGGTCTFEDIQLPPLYSILFYCKSLCPQSPLISTGVTSPLSADTYYYAGIDANGNPYWIGKTNGLIIWSNAGNTLYTLSTILNVNGASYFTSATIAGTYAAQGSATGSPAVALATQHIQIRGELTAT